MTNYLLDFLALTNDVLQAFIVIFGAAVALYNLGRGRRSSVIRAFIALVIFVVIVYLTELLASRIIASPSAESWLRLEWVGIALVPAAQIHLSQSLMGTTSPKLRHSWLTPAAYGLGLLFLGLVLWSDWIVAGFVALTRAPHLEAGPLFYLFTAYFWAATAVSIVQIWHARQQTVTSAARQRMSITLFAFLAAPLGVFPYLIIAGSPAESAPLLFWPIVITGNITVGVMFGLLTSHLIYFGTVSPDRVVRVRLYKFMARVPLAGSIVLLVYVLVSRSSPVLGLPTETALGFALVATVMLVEWAIHAYKRPLERLFQLNDDPDVRRIQELGERLLTTRDLHQFLESVLAATCELLRTPTAFVAAITDEGPKLESVVGPLTEEPETILQETELRQLAQPGPNGNRLNLEKAAGFILWRNYWIRPLYNRTGELMMGIFGIRARAAAPDLSEEEEAVLDKLIDQAVAALEDRILQQEVFAAVEGLLPEISALQERRIAARFGGLPMIAEPIEEELVNDPEFKSAVKDALSHYWGGPKLTKSPLMRLQVVQKAMDEHDNNAANALRAILNQAIELQKPEGERSMTTTEWILYNILELKFVRGQRVRDVARRLAMSESDLYRKQRVAIENVAQGVATLEAAAVQGETISESPE